jgi:hypothetical protein
MDNYYELPYVSNSSFTELERLTKGGFKPKNLEEIYAFGRLTDELIFEPEKADMTHIDLSKAMCMRDVFLKNAMLSWYINLSTTNKQEVVLFKINGINCKMKADSLNRELSTVLEFKTTIASSENQFNEVVKRFNYDRQIAFYMDGARVDKCILAGVSKKAPHRLFLHVIDRTHPWYISGKAKYTECLNLCLLLGIGVD